MSPFPNIESLERLIEDSSAFCCSFKGLKEVSSVEKIDEGTDGDGGASAQDVPMLSVKSEISAFDDSAIIQAAEMEETKVQIEALDA